MWITQQCNFRSNYLKMAKQLLITAKELMQLSIWTDKHKLASARARQLTGTVREGDKIKGYDLSKIDRRFLKQPVNSLS